MTMTFEPKVITNIFSHLKRGFNFNQYVLAAFVIATFIFMSNPQIDIIVAKVFYDESLGFFIKDNKIVLFFYEGVNIMTRVMIVMLIGLFVISAFYKRIRPKLILYFILCLAMGPGLVVNTIFKNNWDRARPAQLVEFGGEKEFSPPLLISDQCETNCSFVSGHASMGFYFIAFAMLMRGNKKKLAMTASILLGAVIGAGRMAQGGHFLSDVIFCGFFVYFTTRYLYNLFYGSRTNLFSHNN